jgi:hypothetical protein
LLVSSGVTVPRRNTDSPASIPSCYLNTVSVGVNPGTRAPVTSMLLSGFITTFSRSILDECCEDLRPTTP